MPIPHSPNKLFQPSLLRATEVLANMGKALDLDVRPTSAILTYQSSIIHAISKQYQLTPLVGLYGDVHWVGPQNRGLVVASNFGIGAPTATVMMENLIALGVTKIISVGIAGSISIKHPIGDIVVCSKALRDEGTSYHYLPDEKFVSPSEGLTSSLMTSLHSKWQSPSVGPTWTTDAPYRETKLELDHYRTEGICTVDMEAAALFAVGIYRQIEVAAAFSISDVADEHGWQFAPDNRKPHASLLSLFKAAVRTLS